MKVAIIIFSFCCFQAGLSQDTPTISYITQKQVRDVGETVELSCTVQHAEEYSVLWIKSNGDKSGQPLLMSSDIQLITSDNRFSVRRDTLSSTYTLKIKDIRETDAGLYQCRVSTTPSSTISADVELQVRTPSAISDNSSQPAEASEDNQ